MVLARHRTTPLGLRRRISPGWRNITGTLAVVHYLLRTLATITDRVSVLAVVIPSTIGGWHENGY